LPGSKTTTVLDLESYSFLQLTRPSRGVLLATLSRPEKLNAIDDEGHAEVLRLLVEVEDAEDVNVLVFTGSGRAFCAGGDIGGEAPSARDDGAEHVMAMYERNIRTVNRLIEFQKPIVAAVNGVAVGAGLRLALLADINVVAEDALLIDGHTRLGVTAGDHSALLWPLLFGMARAKLHLMTSQPMSGAEAASMGVVSMAVPADQVLVRALAIADEMASGPQHALRGTKRALNHWLRAAQPAFEHSAALEALGFLHPDSARAMAAVRDGSALIKSAARDRAVVGQTEDVVG
jgi:enoyl-CoA hydratase